MIINDKIDEIEGYLSEIEEFIPADFDGYKRDFKTKAACERYFEKIVEAVTDLAFLVIKEKGYSTPEEDKQAFDILAKEKVIPQQLAEHFKDAKGMRNILAHKYGTVDDETVFHSITEEIVDDANEFLKAVRGML